MIVAKIILLAAHLLMMNIAAAGPLATSVIQFCGSRRDEHLRRLGQRVAVWSLVCFFVGTALGLAAGCLIWLAGEQQFFHAIGRFPSKVFFGVWELVFYVFCMGIYITWWRWRPPQSGLANALLAVVGLAAATNLLWHFPALMTAIAHIAATEPAGDPINSAGFRELIFRPQLMSHWLHVWMASFATAGLFVSWYALRLARQRNKSEASQKTLQSACAWGGRVALAATLLQMPLGMWLLLSSPQSEQSRLMGGDWVASGFFLASLILALALMHQLAAIAIGNGNSRNVNVASVLLIATITLMSGTLLLARGDQQQSFVDGVNSEEHGRLCEFVVDRSCTKLVRTRSHFSRHSCLLTGRLKTRNLC